MIDPLFIYSFFPAKYLVHRTFMLLLTLSLAQPE